MKLQEKKDGATLVLTVLGRIDSVTSEAFGTALHASIATPGIEIYRLAFGFVLNLRPVSVGTGVHTQGECDCSES
jgi:hypothetical protein